MTNAQLQKRARYWQKRLRLQDFDITVSFMTEEQLGGSDIYGRCWPDWKNGKARIGILMPKLNKSKDPNFSNPELTLLHELVHIILDPIAIWDQDEDALSRKVLEQTVEKLAKGFHGS